MDTDGKVRVYEIACNGSGRFITDALDADALEGCAGMHEVEPGTVFTITVREMTRAELEALPEFDGF